MKPERAEERLRELLRSSSFALDIEPRALFEAAERHGLAGVALDAWRERGLPLPRELERELEIREIARELDHRAHRALLERIDDAFAAEELEAVLLKGPLFAERYYARPAARATSDIDLLVEPRTLDRASTILGDLGFRAAEGPDEERYRREHHHLHFTHPDALPLELHFHGYVAFGRTLSSPVLLQRSVPALGLLALGVLAPADELVFLAVHAAAHRFVRLAWLYDLALLVRTMAPAEMGLAARRADEWGFGRVLAFAASLLVERLGVSRATVEPLLRSRIRMALLGRVVDEPRGPVLRSATRMVYTAALCATKRVAADYLVRASTAHVRRLLHSTP